MDEIIPISNKPSNIYSIAPKITHPFKAMSQYNNTPISQC
jgi:hypothetical protein